MWQWFSTPFRKGLFFGLGILVAGIALAAGMDIFQRMDGIPTRNPGDEVTADEYNDVVGSLQKIVENLLAGCGSGQVLKGLQANGQPRCISVEGLLEPQATVPEAPLNLTLSSVAGSTGVLLTWNAPINNGGVPLKGYEVGFAPDGQPPLLAGFVLPPSVDPVSYMLPLSDGTWVVSVRAMNSIGAGPWTNSMPTQITTTGDIIDIIVTYRGLVPPGAPTNVMLQSGQNNTVIVNWDPPILGGGNITAYEVHMTMTNPNAELATTAYALNHQDDIDPGDTWPVAFENGMDVSVIEDGTTPIIITDPIPGVGGGVGPSYAVTADLAYVISAEDRIPVGDDIDQVVANNHEVIPNDEFHALYPANQGFSNVAVNVGFSPNGNPITSLSAVYTHTIEQQEPPPGGGGGLLQQMVNVGENQFSYTWPNIIPGRVYHFKVRAINAAGPGAFSNEVEYFLPVVAGDELGHLLDADTLMPVPGVPANFTLASAQNGGVLLNWDAPQMGGNITAYEVEMTMTNPNATVATNTSLLGLTGNNLTNTAKGPIIARNDLATNVGGNAVAFTDNNFAIAPDASSVFVVPNTMLNNNNQIVVDPANFRAVAALNNSGVPDANALNTMVGILDDNLTVTSSANYKNNNNLTQTSASLGANGTAVITLRGSELISGNPLPTEYRWTPIIPGRMYQFRVRAINAAGAGQFTADQSYFLAPANGGTPVGNVGSFVEALAGKVVESLTATIPTLPVKDQSEQHTIGLIPSSPPGGGTWSEFFTDAVNAALGVGN